MQGPSTGTRSSIGINDWPQQPGAHQMDFSPVAEGPVIKRLAVHPSGKYAFVRVMGDQDYDDTHTLNLYQQTKPCLELGKGIHCVYR